MPRVVTLGRMVIEYNLYHLENGKFIVGSRLAHIRESICMILRIAFRIAMGNGPFIKDKEDDLPMMNLILVIFRFAAVNNQRVVPHSTT